jgi:hypothetical protein
MLDAGSGGETGYDGLAGEVLGLAEFRGKSLTENRE